MFTSSSTLSIFNNTKICRFKLDRAPSIDLSNILYSVLWPLSRLQLLWLKRTLLLQLYIAALVALGFYRQNWVEVPQFVAMIKLLCCYRRAVGQSKHVTQYDLVLWVAPMHSS